MVEMEAPKKEVHSDFGRHKENITEPTRNSAEEEGDGGNVTEINMQNPAFLSEGTSSSKVAVSAPRSKGEIQRELLDLKRKALAFRRKGETEEAEELLRMAKVLEIQIEELDAPKDVRLHDDPKEENLGSFGLLINTEKERNLKNDMEVRRSTQTAVGPIDEVVKLSVGSGSFAKENQPLPVELGALGKTRSADNQRIAGGFSQMTPPVQSGNLVDLLTGDDWISSQRPVEKQDDSLKFDSVSSFAASPPIQLGSLTFSNEDLASQDNAKIHKRKIQFWSIRREMLMKQIRFRNLLPRATRSAIRQEILAFKRKALALKREGKLTEAREELWQAKLLEKRLEDDSPQSKTTSSDVVLGSSDSPQSKTTTSAGQKDHGSPSLDPKPLSSRDRFKLQQESLGHKRQAMKLRREGRMEEAEAEFELAKALENQLELPAQDSTTVDKVEPLDDVSVEGLLDPQLLSALKAIGIDDASILSQGPGRPEPSKVNAGKSNNPTHDRSQLEEQIKAEKVKAVNLKRAGKQAEALDALRKAKLLEKKLNSSPSK
ncbi:uncharacterized protein Pyn_15276 [Prunus yedoensis var. nudiflora]|uniref:Uncharacterized protein n=1 Tax=Prunus yedoensis var. nudiflora TaxID=2094558 RepID=A0A314XJP4_PRUYE|nr:uncharacterized protein Pyn_15276 [Prunus yedoensis var. nudiflora]